MSAFSFHIPTGGETPALLAFSFPGSIWEHVNAHPNLALGLLALGLFGVLLLVVACRRRCRTLEVFSNASGRVQVSRGALGDLVESAALQYGVVSRPRVDFKTRGDQVHLYVRLKLAAGQRLPEFSTGLQSHLTNTLRDAFGLDKLAGVHLTVTGFKGRALPGDGDIPKPLPRVAPPSPPTPRPPPGNFFST
jgi:hypothetical protein